MNKVNDISEELRSMGSMLADLPRTMPYTIPAGYFDKLPAGIQITVRALNTPEQTPQWGKSMPFAVPEGYFNNLTGNILAAATAEENVALLPKNNPLKVPAGYFETLPVQVLQAARSADAPAHQPQIISLARRPVFRQLKWAAAAILVIGIGIGSYSFFNNTQTRDNPETIIASVPGNDIQAYLQRIYSKEDIDRIVSSNDINNLQLDNKDIVQYLNETGWE